MKNTPDQQAAITANERRICVAAGAGSGKTRTLIARILHLLESGVPLEQIAAITFTEKAAAEMKDRLRRAFHDRAAASHAPGQDFWRGLERESENARIGTIHAFCAAILREYALEANLDPDFGVLAEIEAAMLTRDVIRGALQRQLDQDDPAVLEAARMHGFQTLARIMESLLRARGVLLRLEGQGYPFHDPAALQRRWEDDAKAIQREFLESLPAHPRVAAFRREIQAPAPPTLADAPNQAEGHEAFAALLEKLAKANSADAAESLVKELAKAKVASVPKKCEGDPDLARIQRLHDAMRRFFRACIPPAAETATETDAAECTAAIHAVYKRVEADYAEALAAENCLDFDLLITGTRALLLDRSDIAENIAAGIAHLLIDEFQDTDGIQLEIAERLHQAGKGPALFIVGDAKQSIYAFRGAEVEVFKSAQEAAELPLALDQNFRTRPEILAFINHFFAETGLLAQVEPEYAGMRVHRPKLEDGHGVEFLVPEANEDANAEAMRQAEAALIADRILAWVNERRVSGENGEGPRNARFGDIALLFRAASSIHLYERALRDAGIPYALVAGQGFYARQEVLDFLNLLKTAADPACEQSLLAFLRGPAAGLGDASLLRMAQEGGIVRAFESSGIPDSFEDAPALEHARALIAETRAAMDLPLPAMLRRTLARSGLEAIHLAQPQGVQRCANLRKFIELAEEFTHLRAPSLHDFIAHLERIQRQEFREGEAALQPESRGAVTLMTIHRAKGLEFNIVVVPDMARTPAPPETLPIMLHRRWGCCASVRDADDEPAHPVLRAQLKRVADGESAAESARLLYVALTRARDCLVLSGAPDARGTSWIGEFDRLHALSQRDHQETLAGSGWTAALYRKPQRPDQTPRRRTPGKTPDLPRLQARIAPLPRIQSIRDTISISRLLDALEHTAPAASAASNTPNAAAPARPSEKSAAATPPAARSSARARGVAVHRMFERWDLASPPPIDIVLDELRPGPRRRALWRRELETIAKAFREVLPELGLGGQALPQIAREIPFLLPIGPYLIRGVIDALLPGGILLDYKTGRQTPGAAQRYHDQILLYAAAAQRLAGILPTRGAIYYADHQKLDLFPIDPSAIPPLLRRAKDALASPTPPTA